jgi:hypothetical protein
MGAATEFCIGALVADISLAPMPMLLSGQRLAALRMLLRHRADLSWSGPHLGEPVVVYRHAIAVFLGELHQVVPYLLQLRVLEHKLAPGLPDEPRVSRARWCLSMWA